MFNFRILASILFVFTIVACGGDDVVAPSPTPFTFPIATPLPSLASASAAEWELAGYVVPNIPDELDQSAVKLDDETHLRLWTELLNNSRVEIRPSEWDVRLCSGGRGFYVLHPDSNLNGSEFRWFVDRSPASSRNDALIRNPPVTTPELEVLLAGVQPSQFVFPARIEDQRLIFADSDEAVIAIDPNCAEFLP